MRIPDPGQLAALLLPEIQPITATYLVAPEDGEPDELFALTDTTSHQDIIPSDAGSITLVTVASPIGRVLANAALGEDIAVQTPAGFWRAQVIARDGSPYLSPEERQRARQLFHIQREQEEQAAREQAEHDRVRRVEQNRRDLESDTVRELRERRRAAQDLITQQNRERRTAWELAKAIE